MFFALHIISIKRAVIVFKIVHVTLARFSFTCVAPLPPHPLLLMGRLLVGNVASKDQEGRREEGGGVGRVS